MADRIFYPGADAYPGNDLFPGGTVIPTITGMYNFLPAATPDYDYLLDVMPDDVKEGGGKAISILEAEDNETERRIVLSPQSSFPVDLFWAMLTEAEANTVFDLYHVATKAGRTARSFKWLHPRDSQQYVAMFEGKLPRSFYPGWVRSFAKVRLNILGYIS